MRAMRQFLLSWESKVRFSSSVKILTICSFYLRRSVVGHFRIQKVRKFDSLVAFQRLVLDSEGQNLVGIFAVVVPGFEADRVGAVFVVFGIEG